MTTADIDLNAQIAERLFPSHIGDHDYKGTWEGCGLVLDEMRARGWHWTVDFGGGREVNAEFDKGALVSALLGGPSLDGYARASQAPEAVCRAALAALDAEVQG